MTAKENRPVAIGAASMATGSDGNLEHSLSDVHAFRRRRDTARRLPALECGHHDPIDCWQHADIPATPGRAAADLEAWAATVEHLHSVGCTPMPTVCTLRDLWVNRLVERVVLTAIAKAVRR